MQHVTEAAPPPPIELPRDISLQEFSERYKLNTEDQRMLSELGYIPGDDGSWSSSTKRGWKMPLVWFYASEYHFDIFEDECGPYMPIASCYALLRISHASRLQLMSMQITSVL
ncbi:hypothetical protein DFH06DRAFT_1338435 [Mycena polygramma]|nr:hypothetical protein DFH06DRAFT_1338435 [Mycena polygramma]